jgi:uncharacterized protein (DUF1800 family)
MQTMELRTGLVALCAAAAILPSAAAADTALTPHDLMLLNRVTWGATPTDAAEMRKLGPRRWLDRQLHPSPDDRLPGPIQAEIDRFVISRQPMADILVEAERLRAVEGDAKGAEQKSAAAQTYKQYLADRHDEAIQRSLLRDIYSPDQLQEQMTWFWFNHFNVFSHKRDIRAMEGNYEVTAIRPHALGRFRDLLEATLRHPAMLRFLDNDQNAVGKINENYAREIMELHTMGVGSGYTQKDVQELARILTGVGIDLKPDDPKLPPDQQALYIRQGDFVFNPRRHDFGDKVFLGHTIKGSGFGEVEQALDILSREPATARHISTQLASFLVGDNPPPALVDRMARTFRQSDGDIARVLQTLFDSPEFSSSLGTQFKDPMHYVISAVRLGYGDRTIVESQPMANWLTRLGEGLYDHTTPDGYPLTSAAWSGPGQLTTRFEIARDVGSGAPGMFPGSGDQPKPPVERPPIQALLQKISLDKSLGTPTLSVLGQAGSPQEWNVLFLSSPEFMRR